MSDRRDAWDHDEPGSDFADKVMERAAREGAGTSSAAAPRRRAKIAGVVAGLALAASVTLGVAWRGAADAANGEAIAGDRTQVALGRRAVAVLERGARVAWAGSEVSQGAGEVFYRVDPGGAFRVHTPAGDVEVKGTCFRVKVEGDVNARDWKAGAVGAAMSAVALVSVYEGKVSVSRAAESVTLTAGESARADAKGVRRSADDGREGAGGAASEASDPLVAANANLADSVREYKRRLEAIEAQKTTIAKQLEEARRKLAVAENDGEAPAAKSPYDLDQDDWKELAKDGKVMARVPCGGSDYSTISPKSLNALGLAPQDAQPIHDALERSHARIWAMLRPMCVAALQGSAEVADKLGLETCRSLVGDVARRHEDTDEETRTVAEIRAGLRPMPSDPNALGSYGKMLYAMSGEAKAVEKDLAQSIGPDDARRFTYGNEGSWCQDAWGVGPRPAPAVSAAPPGTPVVTGNASSGP